MFPIPAQCCISPVTEHGTAPITTGVLCFALGSAVSLHLPILQGHQVGSTSRTVCRLGMLPRTLSAAIINIVYSILKQTVRRVDRCYDIRSSMHCGKCTQTSSDLAGGIAGWCAAGLLVLPPLPSTVHCGWAAQTAAAV